MTSLIDTLNNITLRICIYVGFVEWVPGNVGNGITLILFSQDPLRANRTAPYLITLSILNIIYLNYILLTKGIAAVNHSFDGTFGNEIVCYCHYPIPFGFITLIFCLLCWLAFDR
jgi:hypothetical protein